MNKQNQLNELEILRLLDEIEEITRYFTHNKKSFNNLTAIKRENYINIMIGNLKHTYSDIYKSVRKSLEIDDYYMKLNLIADCILFLQNSCKTLSNYMGSKYQYVLNNDDLEIRKIRNNLIGHPLDRLGDPEKGGKLLSHIHYAHTQFPFYKYISYEYINHETNEYEYIEEYFDIYFLSISSLNNIYSFLKKIKNNI